MDGMKMWKDLLAERNPPDEGLLERYRAVVADRLAGRRGSAESLESLVKKLEDADAPEAAAANHNLAVVLRDEGDLDGAVFHAVRGLYLYQRRQDPAGLWAGLRNLSLILQARGENTKALDVKRRVAQARSILVHRCIFHSVEDGRDLRGERLVLLGISAGRPGEDSLVVAG